MKTVFVSGCYDILHAGHIQFFQEARALGDRLVVCFASSEVLWRHKTRKPSLPDAHKRAILESLQMVDQVVVGEGEEMGLDFADLFREIRPDILVVTEDSRYREEKKQLCAEVGADFIILPKTPPAFDPVSSSQIVRLIEAPVVAPLRVDFAGGWLDVPRHAIDGEYIVNCAIQPTVSLCDWGYEQNSGLGGSAAWSLLNGSDGVVSELQMGVGWQDPAVIRETGCCVWQSGPQPVLDFKRNGAFLSGRMAIAWTGKPHDTPSLADHPRDYRQIAYAGRLARYGVLPAIVGRIGDGIRLQHETQIDEGMSPLPEASTALAWKYCGGGWGGYALYLFFSPSLRDEWVSEDSSRRPIEPFTS
ncbi:MAG: adenylyltransferase/cytidyltransferase family protein [Planctomycetota bacterium]|nr:adenylyltransferase/cytidyltransferase family protein [Planctomycetota bacterium]